MRLLAPAKINWTLEVLGRREDGYHDVRTVLQTIDLCDEVYLQPAEELTVTLEGACLAPEEDLTVRAARLLEKVTAGPLPAAIKVIKRVPLSAGLGGGSSDAAAVLRGLNSLFGLGLATEELSELASELGSDVPFFIHCGTALAEGRGERVRPLGDAPDRWLVLVSPTFAIQEKTKRMFGALRPEDFGDGAGTDEFLRRLPEGALDETLMWNTFRQPAFEMFKGLVEFESVLMAAGAKRVQLAGAGPTLFSLAGTRERAEAMVASISSVHGRVLVARTLGRKEALQEQE